MLKQKTPRWLNMIMLLLAVANFNPVIAFRSANIEVYSTEPATVFVRENNGNFVEKGKTPCSFIVNPGSITVKIATDKGTAKQKRFFASGGISYKLEFAHGKGTKLTSSNWLISYAVIEVFSEKNEPVLFKYESWPLFRLMGVAPCWFSVNEGTVVVKIGCTIHILDIRAGNTYKIFN